MDQGGRRRWARWRYCSAPARHPLLQFTPATFPISPPHCSTTATRASLRTVTTMRWTSAPARNMGESHSRTEGNHRSAHNGLVGGSSPPGPTTHSFEPRDFPETSKRPAIGGLRRRRFGLRGDLFRPGGDFGRVV